MPVTTIQGTGGDVSLPTGFGAKLASWTANIDVTVVDTTGFSDNGWRSRRPTKVQLTGSASGTVDDTSLPLNGSLPSSTAGLSNAKGSFTLTAATGCTYGFTGVISRVSMTRANDGKGEITFDFTSTGTVTQTWDQTG